MKQKIYILLDFKAKIEKMKYIYYLYVYFILLYKVYII